MNANNVYGRNAITSGRNIERLVYALLAAVFIGHVYFITGPVGILNVLLVIIGTVIGFMATINLTPIADLIEKGKQISPEILSLVREDDTQDTREFSAKRAA